MSDDEVLKYEKQVKNQRDGLSLDSEFEMEEDAKFDKLL
jgi:hypothetical protein